MYDVVCGEELWNRSVSWDTDHPVLSPCARLLFLRLLPCLLFWILAPFQLIHRQNHRIIRVSALNSGRMMCAMTACLIMLLQYFCSLDSNEDRTPAVIDHLASVTVIASYLLVSVLLRHARRSGCARSGAVWTFVFLTAVAESINYYHLFQDLHIPQYEYLTNLVYLPTVLVLLITCCIADKAEISHTDEKPADRETASFPSYLTHSYLDQIIYKGYKGTLEYEDVPNVSATDKTSYLHTRIWTRLFKNETKFTTVFIGLLRTFWPDILVSGILKFFTDNVNYLSPLLLKWLLSSLSDPNDLTWHAGLLVVAMFAASMAQSLGLNHFNDWAYMTGIRSRLALMTCVYKKAMRMSNEERGSKTVGQIVNLMSTDAENVQAMMKVIHSSWSPLFQISVCMYLLHQELGCSAFAGIASILVVMPLHWCIGRWQMRAQRRQMKIKDQRVMMMTEVLSGIKVVKFHAWEPAFMDMILKLRTKEVNEIKKIAYLSASQVFLFSISPVVSSLLTFTVYALLDESGVLLPAKVFFALSVFNLLRVPLMNLPLTITDYVQGFVSMKRMNHFFMTSDQRNYVTRDDDPVNSISVDHATFSWSESRQSSINPNVSNKADNEEDFKLELDVNIGKGLLVAVVGSVGSGKTSLISALLGDMSLMAGKINMSSSIKSIAYVSQQAWIQNETLKNNVLFGKEMDRSGYEKMLTLCELRTDLDMLPGGDESEIGEKGTNLSGGQKQRLSLCRACYSDADLFLMDDPLAAVDSHVSKSLFQNILSSKTGLLKHKTRILVTNNIDILPDVDHILVMKNGCISESGSYEQLVEKKGAFSEFLDEFSQKSEESRKPKQEEVLSSKEAKGYRPRMVSVCSTRSRTSSLSFAGEEFEVEDVEEGEEVFPDLLIQEEKREIGAVKWKVFAAYFHYMPFFTLVVIFLITSQAFDAYGRYWLSLWSQDALLCVNGTAVVDEHLRNERTTVFASLGICTAVFFLMGSLIMARGSIRAAIKMHEKLLYGVMRSPLSFFETTPIGRIVNRFAKDISSIDNNMTKTFLSLMQVMMSAVSSVVMILIALPLFIVVIVPLVAVFLVIQQLYIPSSRQFRRLESTSLSPIYSHLQETLNGMQVIRAFDASQRFIHESNKKIDVNGRCSIAMVTSNRWLAFRLQVLGNVAVFLCATFAVFSKGNVDAGLLGLALLYSSQISQTLNWILLRWSTVQTESISIERALEYAELKPEAEWRTAEPTDNNNINAKKKSKQQQFALQSNNINGGCGSRKKPDPSWPSSGSISFESYSARYRSGLGLALREVSMSIGSGEKVGVVGRTGAGKSTLTLGLFRMLEAAGGRIAIDGTDIRDVGLHDLRSKLTLIPQDCVLFSGSLRANLDPFGQASDSRLWQALAEAHLKQWAADKGLEWRVAEGGKNLSAGQRQLTCLARALLSRTRVLVLDEATAAVDLETDSLIRRTIRQQFADATVITIAHRIHSVIDSDRVLVMHAGQVAEFDAPHVLLADRSSLFYQLAADAGLV